MVWEKRSQIFPWKNSVRWKNTPALPGMSYRPTRLEHVANCVTHLLPLPTSIFAFYRLYSKASTHLEIFTLCVYGLATVCLFIASSAFHVCALIANDGYFRSILHLCDRVAIYLFIAGSYTPWLVLRNYHASAGWLALWFVWTATVIGITLQCIYFGRCKWVEFSGYVVIALSPACTFIYMHECAGVHLLLIGGGLYILGAVFFKLDGRVPLAHAIWHCFVSVGAYLHYCAVDSFLVAS